MCFLPSFPSLHSITDCKVVGWEARAAVAQDTCWVGGRGGLTPAPAHTCAIVSAAEAAEAGPRLTARDETSSWDEENDTKWRSEIIIIIQRRRWWQHESSAGQM